MGLDRVGARALPDDAAELGAGQDVRVLNGARVNLAHRQVGGVEVVQRLPGEDGLDLLDFGGACRRAIRRPHMRDRVARDVGERQVIIPLLMLEHLARALVARVPDADRLGHAIVIHVGADVALVEVNEVLRLELGRPLRQPIAAVDPHIKVGAAAGFKIGHNVRVKPHFDEVRSGLELVQVGAKACVVGVHGLLVNEEVFRTQRRHHQPPALVGALQLDVKGRHLHVNHLAGRRVGHRHGVRFRVLRLLNDLHFRVIQHLLERRERHAGMHRHLALFGHVPGGIGNGIAKLEGIEGRIVKDAVAVVEAEEQVIDVIGRLRRALHVLFRLRLKLGHRVGIGEHPHDAREHPRDGVLYVRADHAGAVRLAFNVPHGAVVIVNVAVAGALDLFVRVRAGRCDLRRDEGAKVGALNVNAIISHQATQLVSICGRFVWRGRSSAPITP